ncbi:MAG: STAS domain-containing protein [Candidatus Muirbacterium halophilum]|nr:STAS domain-containing protein [Candidatus Muirbacterium halophilum]MCK9475670.1 STAS domain-containing protein [Candidatus Muirbacterium halophilum]
MVKIEKYGEVFVININNDMTKENVKEFEDVFDTVLSENINKIIINFEKVNFVVSQVLGIIIIKTKKLREKEGDIRIVNKNTYIDRLLSIIGIGKIIDVFENIDDALKDF